MLQNWREGSSRDLANRLSSQTVRISLVSFAYRGWILTSSVFPGTEVTSRMIVFLAVSMTCENWGSPLKMLSADQSSSTNDGGP